MNEDNNIEEVLNLISSKGMTFSSFMKEVVLSDIDRFKNLTEWSQKDFEEYSVLLDKAENISFKGDSEANTKEVGDVLEDLVTFIIERTYFFEVIRNIRTRTNEIDLYISRSVVGAQALKRYDISEDLLVIPDKIFLGECKNYDKNIGSTWFGKFYAVMKTCDCDFGILFSLKRATGNFDNWSDSYGLIRTLTLIEKYEHGKDFVLIDFGLSDFKAINKETSFFDIIKRKIIALKTGTNYDNLVKKLQKDLDKEKQAIANEFKELKDSRKD